MPQNDKIDALLTAPKRQLPGMVRLSRSKIRRWPMHFCDCSIPCEEEEHDLDVSHLKFQRECMVAALLRGLPSPVTDEVGVVWVGGKQVDDDAKERQLKKQLSSKNVVSLPKKSRGSPPLLCLKPSAEPSPDFFINQNRTH